MCYSFKYSLLTIPQLCGFNFALAVPPVREADVLYCLIVVFSYNEARVNKDQLGTCFLSFHDIGVEQTPEQ